MSARLGSLAAQPSPAHAERAGEQELVLTLNPKASRHIHHHIPQDIFSSIQYGRQGWNP